MAWLEKKLGQSKVTSGATVTVYTCPAATVGICRVLWVNNVKTTAATATLYHVPAGGAAALSNQLTNEIAVPLKDFTHIYTWVVLSASDTIQATAAVSSSSNLTVTIYGAEVT